MTHLPGYAGYQRLFERDFVTLTPAPQHKYEDFREDPYRRPLQEQRYKTTYAANTEVDRTVTRFQQRRQETEQAYREAQQAFESSSSSSSSSSSGATPTQRVPCNRVWSSVQKDSFEHPSVVAARDTTTTTTSGSRHVHSAPASSEPTPQPALFHNSEAFVPQYLSSIPVSQNLMRSCRNYDWRSGYQRDFGERGTRPIDRTSYEQGISAMATTGDLMFGTRKNTNGYRVPGWSGFVPSAQSNRQAHIPVSNQPPARSDAVLGLGTARVPIGYIAPPAPHLDEDRNRYQKDNLTLNYRHGMAKGYSGRIQPTSNKGPAKRAETHALGECLTASLILDSMK